MINPFKEVNWNPGSQEKRQFARSLVIGFPLLAVAWLFLGKWITEEWPVQMAVWLGGVGTFLGLLFWAFPIIAKPFYVAWYGFACCVGIVISNVLLAGFYFVIVTVFGLCRRSFGQTPIRKTLDKQASTYWHEAERVSDPRRYYSQF